MFTCSIYEWNLSFKLPHLLTNSIVFSAVHANPMHNFNAHSSHLFANFAMMYLKGRSHYSDNQSPTSNNHYFWGGCRRLSEVGKCLSMIGDWLSENYIDNLSPTSDNHPFSGWFSMVGKWLLMIAEQFWSARGFRCSINNHRQPNKAAIQNEYTFDPEKCRWWRNRGRVVLSWSATGCWSWFT